MCMCLCMFRWRLGGGVSLVPRPLPDFISQPWRKIGLQDKIWEWPGDEARCLLPHASFSHFLRACSIVWLVQPVSTLQKMGKRDRVHSGIRNSPSSEKLPAGHSIGPLQETITLSCFSECVHSALTSYELCYCT